MNAKHVRAGFQLFLFFPFAAAFAQFSAFNTDSAYANLHHLAVAIGPREMGSQNEREALAWTVRRLAEFGADPAYVIPVTHSKSTNTTSGVAVGIFPGQRDSIIVIGGHIDSDFRENPGANDDASGVAVMLELARLWSTQPRHYTLLCAAFGGEEKGLVGSQWFVDHYENLDRVALMLQIDMAGSAEALIPFIDVKTHQAPEWLVRDAYALDHVLGYNSLDYPTHFFTFNNLIGGAGSDHQPFLEKNIPAIDFTAGINTSPIHTMNDRMEFIDKSALARSGQIVDGMLKKYDAHGIPQARTGNYMLLEAFNGIWFLPPLGMSLINTLAMVLGLAAYVRSRSRRRPNDLAPRVRFSGSKIFLMVVIIAVFIQLGEAAMQEIKGLRYPWYVPLREYLIFAALFAAAGAWLCLQLTRTWRFSSEPHVYFSRAVIALLLLTALGWMVDSRFALYPACALIFAGLTVLLPGAAAQAIMTALVPLPLVVLMFNEAFPLLSRSLPHNMTSMSGFLPALIYSAVLTVLLIVWYFPLAYVFAATFARQQENLGVLRRLRSRAAGLILLLIIVAYGGYLYAQPAYSDRWRAILRATAQYDAQTNTGTLKLAGDEYFRGVTVRTPDSSASYDDRIHQAEWPVAFCAGWMQIAGTTMRDSVDTNRVIIAWQLTTLKPWERVRVTLQTDTLSFTEVSSPWIFTHQKGTITFDWGAEPADTLQLTAQFQLPKPARLIRKITATYVELPVPITVEAKYADVVYRTEVTWRDTVEVSQ